MKVTNELKEMVVNALFQDMKERNTPSQAEYARYIRAILDVPFDKAALSSIKKAEKRNMLKDTTWIRLAKHFNLMGSNSWQTANTHVYETMQTYLSMCKKYGMWRVLCDHASFGKSYAAQEYAKRHKETVFYIDCSEHSTKSEFIMALARQFGLERTGTYNQLWRDVTDELLLLDKALLILDEFGDVQEAVISLLKSLYNKADMGDHIALGVLHIGADNLNKRLVNGRRKQKQSYAEYWSRFGDTILSLNMIDSDRNEPANKQIYNKLKADATLITDLNLPQSMADMRDELIDKAANRLNLRVIRNDISVKLELIG